MRRKQTAQEKTNERAYEDGERCRRKGLGFTSKGKYDYAAWRRYFKLGFRKIYRWVDVDEAYDTWVQGWNDEDDRLTALRAGYHPCGRPI